MARKTSFYKADTDKIEAARSSSFAVTMLKSARARVGDDVLTFEASKTYNVPSEISERIALSFVRDGIATPA